VTFQIPPGSNKALDSLRGDAQAHGWVETVPPLPGLGIEFTRKHGDATQRLALYFSDGEPRRLTRLVHNYPTGSRYIMDNKPVYDSYVAGANVGRKAERAARILQAPLYAKPGVNAMMIKISMAPFLPDRPDRADTPAGTRKHM
jgi:hypothetical protein